MLLGIALLIGVGGMIGGIAIVLPRVRRPLCPVCMRRTAELVARKRGYLPRVQGGDPDVPRATFYEARYRCRSCDQVLIQRDGSSLRTEAAWEAGIHEALPAATVVERRPS